MEITGANSVSSGTSPASIDYPLAAFVAIATTLTLKAEVFLVCLGTYALCFVALKGRAWASDAIATIDRNVAGFCAALMAIWFYGALLGWYMGWPRGHVMRNFFGLALFLPFLPLVATLSHGRDVWRSIAFAGLVSLSVLLALRLGTVVGVLGYEDFGNLGIPVGASEYGLRIYSFGLLLGISTECLLVLRLFEAIGKLNWRKATWAGAKVIAVLAVISFVGDSKGISLAAGLALFTPILLSRPLSTHIRYLPIALFLLWGHLVIVPQTTSHVAGFLAPKKNPDFGIILREAQKGEKSELTYESSRAPSSAAIFDETALGNQIRYEQFRQLVSDWRFFGRGLGAPISSGYARPGEFKYGFELSYINLIHKLGVVALAYFGFILYSIYKVAFSSISPQEKYVAFSCLCYLVPSLGNPILFAAQLVLLHVLALHVATRYAHGAQ